MRGGFFSPHPTTTCNTTAAGVMDATNDNGRIVFSPSEAEFLARLRGRVVVGREYSTEALAEITGYDKSRVEALVKLLEAKGIVTIRAEKRERYTPSEEARRYLAEGLPEEKLAALLAEKGGSIRVEEARSLLGSEADIAITNAVRYGLVTVDSGVLRLRGGRSSPDRAPLEALARGETVGRDALRRLQRRRLVEKRVEKKTLVKFNYDPSDVLARSVIEVGALTAEALRTGLWRRLRLREYDVTAQPPEVYPGKPHFFVLFLEELRDIMKEMGFIERDYTPVELEFWNYDILFQPQWHPARSPTDTFYIAKPAEGSVERELLERTRRIHERELGYEWDARAALRLILRSHTTSVSARTLALEKPKPPFRFFTIGRVYRVESIDPRHLPEFHQLDGIAAEGSETSFRDLLGLLSEFFERLGISEYKFKLAYFPFTEPSAEGYVKIRGEWMEVLGCGMFRPEVLEALGIDYPVAAWGIGLERIAMAIYGLTDIRQLYSHDLRFLQRIPLRGVE